MNRLKFYLKWSNLIGCWIFILCLNVDVRAEKSPQVEKRFEVSLYTGISDVARLGESYRTLTEKTKIPFTSIDITQDEPLLKAGITRGIAFDSIGIKIYFKQSGSSLIVLHPPFKGTIKTKQIQLFDMEKPPNKKWEDFIIKEFGQPLSKKTGAMFDGDIFFYSWGDVELGRMGLKQLTLYREQAIVEYRQTKKSNSINFFK